MTNPQFNLIEATLQEHPLCRDIIKFLIENESAMDTVRGIAACWVGCDEVAVQSALDRLLICGAVTGHSLSSGTLYGFTRDQTIRAGLRTFMGGQRKRKQETRQAANNLVS